MSIIKETIKYIGKDMNLKFNLGSNNKLLGFQQEIDNLTQIVSTDLINPSIDAEERRIKYLPGITPLSLTFKFYNSIVNNWSATFLNAGFKQDEIISMNQKTLNSFFILDFYDNVNPTTQRKIFTTYLTKIIGYDINGNRIYTPTYTIGSVIQNQFNCLYVPIWYLNSFTGNTVNGYIKFSFYNAINGKIHNFYNLDNGNPLPGNYVNPEKLYFKTEINKLNMTWRIHTTSFPNANAYELFDANTYINKVNNTVVNYNKELQNYPTGNTFNYEDGTYSIIN